MKTLYIFLILMALMAPMSAAAEQPLGDEALASLISGRLKQALNDENIEILQHCDDAGCAVVVQ